MIALEQDTIKVERGMIFLSATVVLAVVSSWLLKPEFSSFWMSHATAIMLWLMLQTRWIAEKITNQVSRLRLSRVLGAIAIAITWAISISFLTDQHPAVCALGGSLIMGMTTSLLWLGYQHSKQSPRHFMMTVGAFLVPAIVLGYLTAHLWREAKEMAALSKLNEPMIIADFKGQAPLDSYWTKPLVGFSSIPGKGFSWIDFIEASRGLDEGKVEAQELKSIYQPTSDYTDKTQAIEYVKTDVHVAGIGAQMEGSFEQESVNNAMAFGRKRIWAYPSFVNTDEIASEARRDWIYTSSPVSQLAPGEAVDMAGAQIYAPKTYALVQQWKQQGLSDDKIIQRALNYFAGNLAYNFDHQITNFEAASMDDFLFNERKGVCEQFSNTFVRMMKMAGIPARQVSGFRGGDIDLETGNLTLRRRDAHAWAEVWKEGQGWVRIDPTDVVPVEKGIPDVGGSFMGQFLSWQGLALKDQWGAKEVVAKKGMRERVFLWMTENSFWILGVSMMVVAIAFLIIRRRYRKDVVQAREDIAWDDLREKMIDKGYDIRTSMGPRSLGKAVVHVLPQSLVSEWQQLVVRYEQWKYAMAPDDTLAKDIARFRRKLPKAT
jgi:hypothetical protein